MDKNFQLFIKLTLVGCAYEDETKINALESELSSIQDELDILEGDLEDARIALNECAANELGALKVVNDTNAAIFGLYISPEADSSWAQI